ncbi:MAG: patatin-like phospholipase family protein [Polyangiales bacterium]
MTNELLDVVFEGGGARGLALTGAVAELETRSFAFGRLVGTSAGAITATLIAAGYRGKALRDVGLERLPSGASRMTTFLEEPGRFSEADILHSTLGGVIAEVLDPFLPAALERPIEVGTLRAMLHFPPFARLFNLVEHGGLYSADGFLAWLDQCLDARAPGTSELTLARFHAATGFDLSLVASDTTATRMLVLNHRTAPELPLRWAVRMSMSIPFVWPEVVWDASWGNYLGRSITGHVILDGGLISNFALRLLVSDAPWITEIMGGPPDPQRCILGLALDESLPVDPGKVRKAPKSLQEKTIGRIERVFDTATGGNDTTEQDVYQRLVCRLPTGGYGTLEFDMSVPQIERLMDAGAQAVDAWLATRHGVLHRVHEARALMSTDFGRTLLWGSADEPAKVAAE